MCGPQGMRSGRPSLDFDIRASHSDFFDSMLRFHAPVQNRDKEHIHIVDWALVMFRDGRKLRKKSWPVNQYAFLYRRGGKLYGNTLTINEDDLKKLSESFSTLIMRADASDQTCLPLGDLGDITVNDWAIYE